MATPTKAGGKSATAKSAAAPKPKAASSRTAAVVTSAGEKAPMTAKPAKAPAKKETGSSGARRALAPDQRRYYVEVAAYYIAERRGFRGDSQLDDWVAAEAEIDRLLREGILNP